MHGHALSGNKHHCFVRYSGLLIENTFREKFWCFGIVLSIHRVLLMCSLLKNNAFRVKRIVSASLFHTKVLCIMSLVVTLSDPRQVITEGNKLGVF